MVERPLSFLYAMVLAMAMCNNRIAKILFRDVAETEPSNFDTHSQDVAAVTLTSDALGCT